MKPDQKIILCPHHAELTPSCVVDTKTGKAFCLGCGWSGTLRRDQQESVS